MTSFFFNHIKFLDFCLDKLETWKGKKKLKFQLNSKDFFAKIFEIDISTEDVVISPRKQEINLDN